MWPDQPQYMDLCDLYLSTLGLDHSHWMHETALSLACVYGRLLRHVIWRIRVSPISTPISAFTAKIKLT